MNFQKEAEKAVRKICNDACTAGIDCGMEHNPLSSVINKSFICPLKKYNVTDRTAPELFSGQYLTETDIFYLCADCENGRVTETPNGESVNSVDEARCLDCPVGMSWDAILEGKAETAMS